MMNGHGDGGKTIAVYIPAKKRKSFDVNELRKCVQKRGWSFIDVQVDGDGVHPDLRDSKIDVFFHKCTDLMTRRMFGDVQAGMVLKSLKSALEMSNPRVLDRFENVERLLDREYQYKMLEKAPFLEDGEEIFLPPFIKISETDTTETTLSKLSTSNVTFPFICKPASAHGVNAHGMQIIFSPKSLPRIRKPFIAHKFINHNAQIYKAYVIGEQVFVQNRPSFPNLAGSALTDSEVLIEFDSSDFQATSTVTPPNIKLFYESSDSPITEFQFLQDSGVDPGNNFTHLPQAEVLARKLSAYLGLKLFGFDVIIESESGRYAVIDVNIFPSYRGVGDLYEKITVLMQEVMDE